MNRKGFTFIELVTVFAIMAILAAILFPVFAKAREKGRQCSCMRNLESVGAALRMYAAEHYGHLPPTDNDLTPLLCKHLPDAAALLCPTLSGSSPKAYPPPTPPQLLAGGTASDYVYRGGLCDDDAPQWAVAADRSAGAHNKGANYLWLDGHAKWLIDYDDPERRPSGTSSVDLPAMGWEVFQRLRGVTPAPPAAPPEPEAGPGGPLKGGEL